MAVQGVAEFLKGSQRPIFLENSTPHSLMTTYQINLISARSIWLNSTFKGTVA
jgi:hypothetical protein